MKKYLPYILIAAVLLIGAGIYVSQHSALQLNMGAGASQNAESANAQDSQLPMEKIQFQNYGRAPEFTGIDNWLNTEGGKPISIADLKGKVVLVDFWTFSCINCIRTLPYVTKWYDTYHDKGFVVVGVHTPEFPFEKVTANVADAIQRYKIHYPVAQDNEYNTWNAFANRYWPAEYLVDQEGKIVYTHFGEGNYDHTENAIRQLLGMDMAEAAPSSPADLNKVGSPEMYFGVSRLEYLSHAQEASTAPADYSFPSTLDLNEFALSGNWKFNGDNAELQKSNGAIRLKFHSGKVYMVAQGNGKPVTLHIKVDGKDQPDVVVDSSKLYTLFESGDYTDHVLEITIPDAGFQAFTFTFG